MKCKDLFRNGNVAFVPAEENLQKQESIITTFANYHNIKIKIELGLWLNPSTTEAERVLKLSYIGDNRKKEKSEKQFASMEKVERIKDYIKEGITMQEMAIREGCTKQAISLFIKYHNIK